MYLVNYTIMHIEFINTIQKNKYKFTGQKYYIVHIQNTIINRKLQYTSIATRTNFQQLKVFA